MENGAMTRDMLNLLANPAKLASHRAARIIHIGQQRAKAHHEIKDCFFDDQCQWNSRSRGQRWTR